MANIFKKIFNFLLFRFTFKIETLLDNKSTKELILKNLKNNHSFVAPIFENSEFAFAYQISVLNINNFSLFGFEGQLIEKEKTTEIKFKAVIDSIIFSFYIIAFAIFFILYIINFEGVREHAFSNPVFALIPIIVIYIIYLMKISEVKSLFKFLFLNEEKRQAKIKAT